MSLWIVRTYAPNHGSGLIVEAERWVDVRDWARTRFGCEVDPVPSLGTPDVTLRWVGHDAGAYPNRRLEVVEHKR